MLHCICEATLARTRFSDKHDLMRCPACQTGKFVDREQESMVEFNYDSSDDKYGNETYLNTPEFRWAHDELAKLDWTGCRVLEIGCFTGFFQDRLRGLGADVTGVEVNREAVAAGERLYGLAGRICPDLDSLPSDSQFDRIVMIDVLEHIEQPGPFLATVLPLLKPGGTLSISSPTIERRFHDKSDFPPHHHWWFSREGLRRLTTRSGLELAGASIQHDGMLLFRNVIGRTLYGFSRREFNGEGSETISAIARSGDGTIPYRVATRLGELALRAIGFQYCSYLFHARKAG